MTFRFNRAVISEATAATSAVGGSMDAGEDEDEAEEKEVEVDTSPGSKIGIQVSTSNDPR